MALSTNFSDLLADLKRRARMQGREVSEQEVSGIAAGYSEQASSRLARQKQLELDKQRHEETLAQQKSQYDESVARAREERSQDREDARHTEQRRGYLAFAGALANKYCIIITACTSKNSPDVEISREFRDKYMSSYHLGGYYALAHKIVPLLRRSKFFRLLTKRFLVDRLVDYGEWILGYKPKIRLRTSIIVTNGFLLLCAAIGMQINVQPYIEAHR